MAKRVYHWKHGWIPLDHYAALSKAHGSHAGATRIMAKLQPVKQEHVRRRPHITVAHAADRGRFSVLDAETGHSASLSDADAAALHDSGRTITGVGPGGRIKTTLPTSQPDHWAARTAESVVPTSAHAAARAAAVGKIQQAHRHSNGHVVTIEASLTEEQTKMLLDSINHAVSNAGSSLGSEPVTFHVPRADGSFRSGRTLAYVRKGQRTVHVSPMLAKGEGEQDKGTNFFMPAHEVMSTQRYALTHELGHVVDHQHDHTRGVKGTTQAATSLDKQLFNQFRGAMSQYGASNPQEAYAEAYAQWHSGIHNAISDAYAERYGWTR